MPFVNNDEKLHIGGNLNIAKNWMLSSLEYAGGYGTLSQNMMAEWRQTQCGQ